MAEYRLYCFGESGNSYKAALMLALTGADWEPKRIDYFNGETRGDAFRSEVNELGECPVLEHQGKKMTQSGVILTWLAERTGKFGPRNADERLEVLRWLLYDNHKFTSYFATLRFMVGLQKTGESPVTEFLRTRAGAVRHRRQASGDAALHRWRRADHRRHLDGGLSLLPGGDGHRPQGLSQHRGLDEARRGPAGLEASL